LTYLDGNGVGIDHNETSVEVCRSNGLTAYTPEEFLEAETYGTGSFDALIVLHVLEHLEDGGADELLETYLPFIRPEGRVVLVTPQERGFASDETHTHLVSGSDLVALCERHGLLVNLTVQEATWLPPKEDHSCGTAPGSHRTSLENSTRDIPVRRIEHSHQGVLTGGLTFRR
jgi:hypothetical protein